MSFKSISNIDISLFSIDMEITRLFILLLHCKAMGSESAITIFDCADRFQFLYYWNLRYGINVAGHGPPDMSMTTGIRISLSAIWFAFSVKILSSSWLIGEGFAAQLFTLAEKKNEVKKTFHIEARR